MIAKISRTSKGARPNDGSSSSSNRGLAIKARPHELDAAVGHFTVLGFEQAGDGFQRRRLSSPISAEQGHDLAFRDLQRQPLQDEDHLAIDYLDIVQTNHRAGYHPLYFPN